MPVGLWGTYLNSGLDPVEQHMFFELNGTKLLYSSFPDSATLDSQGEEYV